MTTRSKHWLWVLTAAGLVTVACTTGGPYAGSTAGYNALNMDNRVVIDRDTVTVTGPRTVLELLENRVARFRFSSNALGRSPLVVVDDVLLVDGIEALRTIRASDVDRVNILWPSEAGFRFGNAGGSGAIVVRTRTGRRR